MRGGEAIKHMFVDKELDKPSSQMLSKTCTVTRQEYIGVSVKASLFTV